MKKITVLILLLSNLEVFASEFLKDLQKIKTAIANEKIGGSLEFRHSPGLTSFGDATGAFSQGTMNGVSGALDNMYLHLNQIYASTSVEKPLGDGISLVSGGTYQGSNIGKRAQRRQVLILKLVVEFKFYCLLDTELQNFRAMKQKIAFW